MNRFAVALLVFVCAASVAHADDGAAIAAKFGALPSIQQISLSPDGTHVAYISPVAGGQAIYVADVLNGGEPKPIMGENEKGSRVNQCQWTTTSRLVCDVSYTRPEQSYILRFSRSFAMDSNGKKVMPLTPVGDGMYDMVRRVGVSIVDLQIDGMPGYVLASDGARTEAIDTVGGKHKILDQGLPPAGRPFLSDGYGTVRVMAINANDNFGYVRPSVRYKFKRVGSRSWEPLSEVAYDGTRQTGFQPYAVDRAKNLVYGVEGKNGFQAVYSIALDGSGKREVLSSRPNTDVDQLITIGRNRRVVGTSYATDRRQAEFFDPELKRLATALGKALPGNPNLEYVDASEGEGKLLMIASGDTNPGMAYLYDKGTHRLEEVLPLRAQLADVKLAPMRAITYPAADGTQIPAYLTLPLGGTGKNLPAIVMPHGGPSARDEWGFDWLVQFFAARGYAVLQPNYRGSAGYGSAWFQKNGFQSWRTAIGDVNAAGHWLIAQGITAPDKLGIFGWSYGGYAALQSSVLEPGLFKAIVAVAPVTDLATLRTEGMRYTSGGIVDKMIGQGPHVREGSPAQNASAIKVPVMLFHGDMDQNVGVGESRMMASRLKKTNQAVTYVEFPALDHQLESAAARTRLLGDSDAFFRKNLKIAP